jgi:hypothetical protein
MLLDWGGAAEAGVEPRGGDVMGGTLVCRPAGSGLEQRPRETRRFSAVTAMQGLNPEKTEIFFFQHMTNSSSGRLVFPPIYTGEFIAGLMAESMVRIAEEFPRKITVRRGIVDRYQRRGRKNSHKRPSFGLIDRPRYHRPGNRPPPLPLRDACANPEPGGVELPYLCPGIT